MKTGDRVAVVGRLVEERSGEAEVRFTLANGQERSLFFRLDETVVRPTAAELADLLTALEKRMEFLAEARARARSTEDRRDYTGRQLELRRTMNAMRRLL